jgi:hypothetical protein
MLCNTVGHLTGLGLDNNAHIRIRTIAIFITANTIFLFKKEVRKLGFEHSTLGITMSKSAEKACFYATFEAFF